LPLLFFVCREVYFEVIYVLVVKMQRSVIDLDVGYVEQPILMKAVWVVTVSPPKLLQSDVSSQPGSS
jgi:hypothetical protein